MKKTIVTALIATLLFSCASIETKKLTDTTSSTEGFYYALPKANLLVSFEIKQTTKKQGKYAMYATCLGYNPKEVYIGKDSSFYSIKSVSVTPKTYLDSSHIFQLKINQAFMNKTDFSMEYSKTGELNGAEQAIESQIIPFATSVVNLVSSLKSGSVINDGGDPKNLEGQKDADGDGIPDAIDLNPDFNDCLNAFVEKDMKALEMLQTAVFNVLKVNTAVTKEQLDARLGKIDGMKNEILVKYLGKKVINTKIVTFEISPEQLRKDGTIELFKIEKAKGLERLYQKNWNDISKTKSITYKAKGVLTKAAKTIGITFNYLDPVPDAIKNNLGAQNTGSFYYRIPNNTEVAITKNNTISHTFQIPIPQLGITVAAPKNLRKFSFKLHPGLGSIYTISAETDSLKLGELDALKKSLIKSKDDKTIEALEKEFKIKELKDKIEKVGVETEDDEGE